MHLEKKRRLWKHLCKVQSLLVQENYSQRNPTLGILVVVPYCIHNRVLIERIHFTCNYSTYENIYEPKDNQAPDS